jgi:hypothetical protein
MSNYYSSIDWIRIIRNYIAPLFLLFGVILIVSGFFNAISTNTIITLSNGVIVTYPKLVIGAIVSIAGLVIAVLSYLVFHGKIELKRIFP